MAKTRTDWIQDLVQLSTIQIPWKRVYMFLSPNFLSTDLYLKAILEKSYRYIPITLTMMICQKDQNLKWKNCGLVSTIKVTNIWNQFMIYTQ